LNKQRIEDRGREGGMGSGAMFGGKKEKEREQMEGKC